LGRKRGFASSGMKEGKVLAEGVYPGRLRFTGRGSRKVGAREKGGGPSAHAKGRGVSHVRTNLIQPL